MSSRPVRFTAKSIFPQQSSLPPETATPRVMIVATQIAALQLASQLEQGSCTVFTCGENEPVMETLSILAPDLVVIECTALAVAFELCGEIRASDTGRHIPILLAAPTELDEQCVSRALLVGADDVIVFGERPLELQARVRVQLRNKRDRDRLTRVRAERDSYQREAKVDALTGIPNRRTFDVRVGDAHRAEHPYAVLFVDVDHFKRVNDAHGHDVGDGVLQAVAHELYRNKRAGDTVARYGGEEFVVVLHGVTQLEAMALAEAHRRAIEALVPTDPAVGQVTVSIGVSMRERTDANAMSVCRRADDALYTSKREGRNRVSFAGESMPGVPQLESLLLKKLAGGRAGLPLVPAAAREALRLAEDPKTDIARIARLVDRDPSLAARFIALASSAGYSGRVRPTTTTAAIVRIGLLASRDLLLQAVYERAADELPAFNEAVARSFSRSVRCASTARAIGRFIAPSYDLAYLCGLLHDIGEARIYRILAHVPDARSSAPEEIERLVRRHHERAGADVALVWKLPEEIMAICKSHHDGPIALASTGARLVRGAEALLRIYDDPEGATAHVAEVKLLADIGISNNTLQILLDEVRATATPSAQPAAI